MRYDKPPTTVQEQIELLRSRGLTIAREDYARHILSHVSYYRLGGYWLPFEIDHAAHRFRTGVRFDDVVNLYSFDRELRLLLLDAIERVEVSLRSHWAATIAHAYGPHGHLNTSHVARMDLYDRHLSKLSDDVDRSDEVFIRHYRGKYDDPRLPPVWAVSEIMSFGLLSRWIAHMKPSDRARIAAVFHIDQKMLKGFVHHLAHVRNLCAHHSRVWNRNLTITMPLPQSKPGRLIQNMNSKNRKRIYNTLVMLVYLLDITSPGERWKMNLVRLIEKFKIDTKGMGFPDEWKLLPIWSSTKDGRKEK